MKKLTILIPILIGVLAVLLVLTGVASASPDEPRKFRIEGYTTSFDLMPRGKKKCTVLLLSQGKVTRHIQGTFTMTESLYFDTGCANLRIPDSNEGTLTILPKQGGEVQIGFESDTGGEPVSGTFKVVRRGTTGDYLDLVGRRGTYEGIPDTCTITGTGLDCTGFYVDFTFDTY